MALCGHETGLLSCRLACSCAPRSQFDPGFRRKFTQMRMYPFDRLNLMRLQNLVSCPAPRRQNSMRLHSISISLGLSISSLTIATSTSDKVKPSPVVSFTCADKASGYIDAEVAYAALAYRIT
ncbi:hypothetical protein DFH27DRAFT_529425 [Peziza echinospora]|nr:hypothetical protein DFH27DRAFT_529425 [Peziza echinospora]